jgi:hypothetical protein
MVKNPSKTDEQINRFIVKVRKICFFFVNATQHTGCAITIVYFLNFGSLAMIASQAMHF